MDRSGITVRLRKDSNANEAAQVSPYRSQNYGELRHQSLQQRCLFNDPEFRPCFESLGYSQQQVESKANEKVVWMRPQEICQPRHPHFIHEGMHRTDVCQGKLGNCWFLASAASLTMYPQLLYRVVPRNQSFDRGDYAGIFHFQFWQYGQWVDVVVDDLLPTMEGELIFVRSVQSDEFWMPLLEKAYAKLNGSYVAIEGGFMNEAFVDFTGGIGETFDLESPDPMLFDIVQAALSRRSLMGAQIKDPPPKTGLEKWHAYSITAAHMLNVGGRTVRLLRLRNPWGKREWTGRWSDKSPVWSTVDPAQREQLHLNKEDGEFWMQLTDFVHYFDELEICHLSADKTEEKASSDGWNVVCLQGSWIKGHTAGGNQTNQPRDTFWMNHQYHISLREPDESRRKKQKDPICTLLVSLMQKDRRRTMPKRDFLVISLHIFVLTKEYLQAESTAQKKELLRGLKPARPPLSTYKREISGYFKLPPGEYLIIPCTQSRGEEADFTLRVFTEKKQKFLEIDEEIHAAGKALQIMIPPEIEQNQVLKETFQSQAGQDKQIGPAELQAILNRNHDVSTLTSLETDGFSKEQCEKIIQRFSGKRTGKLELHEFKQLCARIKEWEHIFVTYDWDKSGTMNSHELRLALNAAGFHLDQKTRLTLLGKYINYSYLTDFDNFVSLMVHLESVFEWCKHRDTNGDGVIVLPERQWMDLIASN